MQLFEHFNTTNQTSPHFERHESFVTDINLPTCAFVQTLPYDQRCAYVRQTDSCGENMYIVDYIDLLYCQINPNNRLAFIMGVFFLVVLCLYMFIMVGVTADTFFCPALKVLCNMLRMTENVAGVTLLAFGNSASDLFTGIAGLQSNNRVLFSDVFSSMMFVLFCVAGLIITLAPFDAQATSLVRDILFLMLDVALIDYLVKKSNGINLIQACRLYILYIIVVLVDQYLASFAETDRKSVVDAKYPHLKRKDIEVIEAESQGMSFYTAVLMLMSRMNFFNFLRDKQKELYNKRKDMTVEDEENIRKLYSDLFDSSDWMTTHMSIDSMQEFPDERENKQSYKKGIFDQFIKSINPINREEWREKRTFGRIMYIVTIPIRFGLYIIVPIVDFDIPNHGWSKLLNCIQIAMLPTLFYLASFGWDYDHYIIVGTISSVSAIVGVIVFIITKVNRVPRFHQALSILSSLTCVYLIYIFSTEIISILTAIGIITHRSNSYLGCTLLTWGNSVTDLVMNVAMARQGCQRMAFAACFGAPLFLSLLMLGSVFIYNCWNSPTGIYYAYEGTLGGNCPIFLLTGLFCTLFGVVSTNFSLRRSIGIFMMSIYMLYQVYALLGEFDVIHPYGSDHKLDMKAEPSEL